MQCFTRPSLLPRTSLSIDYREPSAEHYKQRRHFIPEPDRNGRMWCPDAFKPPLPFKQPSLVYEPFNGKHRNGKMDAMLEHVNRVNWTTGQDSVVRPLTESTVFHHNLDFRHSDQMPTVTHTTYVDHGPQAVDRKYQPQTIAVGIPSVSGQGQDKTK